MFSRSKVLSCVCFSSFQFQCLRVDLNFQKFRRLYSILKPSFVSDLSLDIDINTIKEEHMQLLRSGNRLGLNIQDLVNKELELKCSETIQSFTGRTSKMVKVIKLEHSFLFAEGWAITPPDDMTNKQWLEAMTLSSMDDRLSYYLYLEKMKSTEKLSEPREEVSPPWEGGDGNPYFMNNIQYMHPMLRSNDYRLATALRYGIPLVFDMGFDDHMTNKQISNTAKQLWMAYLTNMDSPQPFHFVFTSCHRKSFLARTLELNHSLQNHHFLVSETEDTYLKMFPPAEFDLVYLSPFSKKTLKKFDPNAVYILGAYSDSKFPRKFDMSKSKEQNIECMKLPIDNHIKWLQGNKDLPLNSIVQVLLNVKGGMDWKDAFARAIPSNCFTHYPDRKQPLDLDEVMRD